MRRLLMTCLLAATPMTANAELCDTAERGTYLSNICFLVKEEGKAPLVGAAYTKVISAVSENCTAVIEIGADGMLGVLGIPRMASEFGVKVKKKNNTRYFRTEINFNKANLRASTIGPGDDGSGACWTLRGEGVTGNADEASFCVSASVERVRGAFNNLYSFYCESVKSEF